MMIFFVFLEVRGQFINPISKNRDLNFRRPGIPFMATMNPGDEVIALSPYFVEYGFYVENHGGSLVVAKSGPDFLPSLENIRNALTARTRAIIVNSPNNPTGSCACTR